jgi:tyrosyl-tRNA synthetase
MSSHRSELIRELSRRGFIRQAAELEALDALAAREPVVAYIGYDCTADSLHVGHQLSIMVLRWLQRTGHRPIALIGGGTTKVGDPSGKDETRQLLDEATIAANIAGIKRSLSGFLRFGEGPGEALMVNNAEWLDQLNYIEFLRDYGRHFTVNRMLTFESVKARLDRQQPLTFLEFNYMIMQAYDFLELARRYDCRLQAGGSDQWGNILNGVDLGRRVDGRQLFGVTTPLVTTASGAKMGKTAAGAVWLNRDKDLLRPSAYWQYWRNVDDRDVGRFLRWFTELPLDEIERLERLQGAELNEAKEILAREATRLCRGAAAAAEDAEAARTIFGKEPVEFSGTIRAKSGGYGELSTTEIPRRELAAGITVVELLRRSGLVSSNSEGRRLIRGGGARLNDAKITDETLEVDLEDLTDGELTLSAGRKRHARIRMV